MPYHILLHFRAKSSGVLRCVRGSKMPPLSGSREPSVGDLGKTTNPFTVHRLHPTNGAHITEVNIETPQGRVLSPGRAKAALRKGGDIGKTTNRAKLRGLPQSARLGVLYNTRDLPTNTKLNNVRHEVSGPITSLDPGLVQGGEARQAQDGVGGVAAERAGHLTFYGAPTST